MKTRRKTTPSPCSQLQNISQITLICGKVSVCALVTCYSCVVRLATPRNQIYWPFEVSKLYKEDIFVPGSHPFHQCKYFPLLFPAVKGHSAVCPLGLTWLPSRLFCLFACFSTSFIAATKIGCLHGRLPRYLQKDSGMLAPTQHHSQHVFCSMIPSLLWLYPGKTHIILHFFICIFQTSQQPLCCLHLVCLQAETRVHVNDICLPL